MKGDTIYAVLRTETDRDRTVIDAELETALLGAFGSLRDASAAINEELRLKTEALRRARASMADPLRERLSEALRAVADATGPDEAADALRELEAASERLRRCGEDALPEFLVQQDADGNLCEVSASDEELGWMCHYDIHRTEIR